MVILRRKLVQALLDDVVPVKVLDEHDDVQAQSQNDGVNLDIAKVSLRSTCKQYEQRLTGGTLACLRVERKSIIF